MYAISIYILLACIIRCGTHYFFNLPETMSNTFETTTLKQVEKNIANLEELFLLEGEANIVKDLHANSKLSLVQNSKLFKGEMEPLSLMPLKDAKYRSTQKKRKIEAPVLKSTKRAMTMRNSFYPYWIHNLAKTREFAKTNGFWEVPAEQNDFSCSISLLFHQRELKMVCNRRGILQSIKHRNTRWLSATFNHVEKIDGIDVRVYLETRAELDDDEKVLETLISYLDGRSIFSETFLKQMEQVIDNEMLEECVNPKPLIPDMNTFNFTFQNMRHLTPLLKFVNAENDIFMLHKINDGIFNESRLFEWFNEHYEVEFNLNLERSDVELCKKSFDLSLKLFDYSKQ